MGTLVNAENIRGVYYTGAEDVVAVNDVSIKIEEGEVLGLAGESGVAKPHSARSFPPRSAAAAWSTGRWRSTARSKSSVVTPRSRTWRGAVVSMLPQGAMNSVSPTKRIRHLVYDVMRSHDSKISKDEALDRAGKELPTLGPSGRVLDAYPPALRWHEAARSRSSAPCSIRGCWWPMSRPQHSM